MRPTNAVPQTTGRAKIPALLSAMLLLATPPIAAAPADSDSQTAAPIVTTRSGQVGGSTNGDVAEWRAIPYAAPPVGNLRWRPPAPPQPWTGVRTAPDFAPQCLQLNPPGDPSPTSGSEDCLYLNVFAPARASAGDHLPVMVHLHGGGNYFFHAYRDAETFTQRGVIVVTIDYRLGVFGFVGHPALTAEDGISSGEYGILDQIAALHWVQDNITAFGGDPANVTLFGESAGSFDAVAIAASGLGRGLFTRLAAQTAAFWALNGVGTIRDAEALGADVADRTGCSDAVDVLACLRAQPAEDLVIAAGAQDVPPWVGGRVLSQSPLKLIAADPHPVPMLLGSNREEAALWFADGGILPPGDNYGTADRYRDTNFLVGPLNGARLRSLYPIADYGSPFWASIAAYSDAVFTCPIRRLALASKGPVYRYLYTHTYQTVPDPVVIAARAAHFFDDPILWHDPTLLFGLDFAFSAGEQVLAGQMADYWTNFAKSGDPNGSGQPAWPAFTSATQNIKVLDTPGAGGDLVGYHNSQCGFLDSMPALQGHPVEYTPGAPYALAGFSR